MGFDDGQLVLNSDNGTYFPGQMLYGRLEFDLDKDKKFRGIYADIKGKCKVHWTTSHSRRVNDRTEHYTVTHESYEEYMNVTVYLIGSKSGEQVLHPGRHVFPFECQIPPHCPSSYEGSDGSIRYTVKVTVDRAFKMDQTKQASFRVEAPLNLNEIPDAKEPMVFQFEQTYCCWCMNAGLTETLVKLPASGFVPRQVMPIEVACNNNSTVEIDTIRFCLKKTITFEAQREPDTRYSESVVAEIKKGPIPGNTVRNYTVEMEVPDMDVPNLNNCRFISIDYRFKVEIATSGCHTDEDDSSRIFIGTIPIASLQYPPNSNFETANNTQGITSYPSANVVNQPLVNGAPYPGANPPYPGANPPYPGANPPYPGANPPYPGANPPYPGANPPFPGSTPNIGFTAEKPPYPAASPYPAPSPYPVGPDPPYPAGETSPYQAGGNPPYPGGNPPYPGGNTGPPLVTSPHVNSAAPYPNSGRTSPYPPNVGQTYPPSPNVGANPPYPTTPPSNPYQQPDSNPPSTNSPYPSNTPVVTGLKTGTFGFTHGSKEAMPLLPPGGMPRPTSPFASASAPPATPDDENKKLAENVPPYPQ